MSNPACIECGKPATLTVERTTEDGRLLDNGPTSLCGACAQSPVTPEGRWRSVVIVLGLDPLVGAEPQPFDAQGRD